MPPRSDNSGSSSSSLSRNGGQDASPERLNLGCGTLLGGICLIAVLGKLLPHETLRPTPPAQGGARHSVDPPPRTKLPPKTAKDLTSPSPAGPVRPNAEPSRAPSGERPIVFNSPWNKSVWQVERYLKRRLYDAESFEALDWGPVIRNAKGYQVRCTFRSKNLLGRYVTQSKTFYLNRSGDVYAEH